MHAKTKTALIAHSVPSDLIEKIASRGHTLENLRSFSKAQLRNDYSADEADLLATKLRRHPIDDAIVDAILDASGTGCAYCADGLADRPFEIHHIVPYAQTQDNSEDNLILVCPTHHAWIHATNETAEAQRRKRREWYATVEIRHEYETRGITFSHGVFEPIDYGSEPRILEVLEGVPSPRTAMELSKHSLADRVVDQLGTARFALVVGASGSGKSTLAVGVAGRVRAGGSVYRYRAPQVADRRGALAEVLTMLSVVAKPAVLILDDANTWASASDLLRLKQASGLVSLIATWTGGGVDQVTQAELHAVADRVLVGWDSLREPLYQALLDHEGDVVGFLRGLRHGDARGVGMGRLDASLRSLLERYGATVPSIGQFLFLLRGGAESVGDDVELMIADGRADLPVLVAAIEQIAGFEQPVTPAHAADALRDLPVPRGLPPVDSAWVERVFDGLVDRRLMVRVRSAYTTLHRDWALALLGRALWKPTSRPEATALLERELVATAPSPRRLMILWSWLWSNSVTCELVRSWVATVSPQEWATLVGNAARTGLVDLAMVSSRLHLLRPPDQWTETFGSALEANEDAIAALVRSATEKDWPWLRDVANAIGHARASAAARVIGAWPPSDAARIVSRTHPDEYDAMSWFFGEAVKHCPDWCAEVGRELSWDAIHVSLRQVSRGDVASVDDFEQILARLRVPLIRSRVRLLVSTMVQAVRGASLAELRFAPVGSGIWLQLFPEHVRELVDALDAIELAKRLATAPPRQWETLLVVSRLARRAGSDFGTRFVDALPPTLAGTVERYAPSSPHELRVLLWQLTEGSPEVRRLWAKRLRATVATVSRAADHEREQILRAYAVLDTELARAVADELGLPLPAGDPQDLRTLHEGMSDEWRAEFARLEASGEDYDIASLFRGSDAPEAG